MTDKPAVKYIKFERSTGNTTKRTITGKVPAVKDEHNNMVKPEKAAVYVEDPILLSREEAFTKADAQAKKDGYLAISLVEEEQTHFAFKLSNPIIGKVDEKKKGGEK